MPPQQGSGRRMIWFSAKESCHAHPETQGVPRQPQHKVCRHFHLVAYTAQGVAALTHMSGKELAKTVIVSIDKALAMALVPGSLHIDLSQLRSAASVENIAVASEEEFKERLLDCETGAMPAFGNLYNMPVFAGESLARDKEIVFNAGSHRELVRVAWEDFVRLVEPK